MRKAWKAQGGTGMSLRARLMSEEIVRDVLRNAQDDVELQRHKQERLRRARLEFFARVYALKP